MKHTLRIALACSGLWAGCGGNGSTVDATPEAVEAAADPGGQWQKGAMPATDSGPSLSLANPPQAAILGESAHLRLTTSPGQGLTGVYIRPQSDDSGYWDVPVDVVASSSDSGDGDETETGDSAVGTGVAPQISAVRKQTADYVDIEISLPRAAGDVDLCFLLRGYDGEGNVGGTLTACFTGVRVRDQERNAFGPACDRSIECGVWEPEERDECIATGSLGVNILRDTAPSCEGELDAYRGCITALRTCEEIDALNRAIANDDSTIPFCQAESDAVIDCSIESLFGDVFDSL